MASAIATRKVEDEVSAGPDVSPFPAGRGKLRPVADAGGEADRVSALPIRRARFSGLTRRIIFFNAFALLVFVAGVLWVQNNRAGLVDERIAGIRDQALIVAGALAEYTADQERRIIDLGTAEPLLRQLIAPTRLRAQIYGTDGQLRSDTRNLLIRNSITREELPPPQSSNAIIAFLQRGVASVRQLYDEVVGLRRSEEHTSELQSQSISYAVFC